MQLESIRKAEGLSKWQLANKAKVQQSSISDIESGATRFPRSDTLQKLASALNCTVDDILRDKPSACKNAL